jgi:ATP-dependent Lon protease
LHIRAIKDELGEDDDDDDDDDVAALEKKMQEVGMPPNVWKHAQQELRYKFPDANFQMPLVGFLL